MRHRDADPAQAAPGSTTPPLPAPSSRTTISLARSQESRPRLTLSRPSGACNPSIARARYPRAACGPNEVSLSGGGESVSGTRTAATGG
eukprot:scaffold17218_cov99-Phaeocystis_antarctica.AAC.4